jgi:hypothetical protein
MPLPLTAACVVAAASAFHLAAPALWTILETEHGRVGACTVQANGRHDCGPAQVNAETWVPHLARLLHRPEAEIFYALRDDGCFNVEVASYVLRLKIDAANGDVWDGIGRYNSATPALKRAYQRRIVESYRRLYGAAR